MKSKVVSSPPGEFSKPDIYSRKRWRRIQHIANEFWSLWKKEYLQSLQERQKWEGKRRNFKIGDIVAVYQNNVSRNHWPMARIIDPTSDKKGLVGSVLLRMGERSGNENSKRKLERTIDKTVLIMGSDEVRFPAEKPTCWNKMSYLKGSYVKLHHEGVESELCLWSRTCLSDWKMFCNPCVQGLFVKPNWLVFRTCFVLINKVIKLKVINTVINFKWLVFPVKLQ